MSTLFFLGIYYLKICWVSSTHGYTEIFNPPSIIEIKEKQSI